jgi:hypothetical protein
MKNFAKKALLLFSFWLISLCAEAAVSTPIKPIENIEHQIGKKEMRQRIKSFRKTHREEMKGMNAKARKAYIADGISREQLIPNGWLPTGITLIVIGAIMALFGGIIAWVGGAVALVGIAFCIVWLVQEINSPY